MTFRPSVLPDRDNDILSTFTRSFEKARSLVRQDQADKRASLLFKQGQIDRERDIEDRDFEAAARIAEDPGMTRQPRGVSAEQIRIQSALGANIQTPGTVGPRGTPRGGRDQEATDIAGGGMIPAIPGRAIGAQLPGIGPQQVNRDPENRAIEQPDDFQDLGEFRGQRVTVSAAQRRAIERSQGDEDAADVTRRAEAAGAPGRARTENELEIARDTVRSMVGAGLLTDARGNRIELADLPDNFDPEAILSIIGRQETARGAQVTRAVTPGAAPRQATPAQPGAVERGFQDDLRTQIRAATAAERTRLTNEARNAPQNFANPDAPPPNTEPDAVEIERQVLAQMRRLGSAEEIPFIDARIAQLDGGSAPPPGGGGGGGADAAADQSLADAISDADDPAQELQELGVTGERAARVLALIGG